MEPEGRERWFETAIVLWLGAIVPPFGVLLALGALWERVRSGRWPRLARWPVVVLALLPTLILAGWAWDGLTELRYRPETGRYEPLLDLNALGVGESIFTFSVAVHLALGSLCGALWGARIAGPGEGLLRAALGAIAGAGWAWCLTGGYLLHRAAMRSDPLPATLGAIFFLVPLGSLLVARSIERSLYDPQGWVQVAD